MEEKQEQEFMAKFLAVYGSLNEKNRDLVLAFVDGMEFQRGLEQRDPISAGTVSQMSGGEIEATR